MVCWGLCQVCREGEADAFKAATGNRRLLWHGSRLSNWAAIFARGLRVAPEEAPLTGYMFGKGIYFADMATKAAQYCFAPMDAIGVLSLCEVALGESYGEMYPDSYPYVPSLTLSHPLLPSLTHADPPPTPLTLPSPPLTTPSPLTPHPASRLLYAPTPPSPLTDASLPPRRLLPRPAPYPERLTNEYEAERQCRHAKRHSTWGRGKTVPCPLESCTLPGECGVSVPKGRPEPSNVEGGSLLYNEFIVYDPAQVRQRFALQVKFVHAADG